MSARLAVVSSLKVQRLSGKVGRSGHRAAADHDQGEQEPTGAEPPLADRQGATRSSEYFASAGTSPPKRRYW